MAASDAFPTLTPAQTERLRAVGAEEAVQAGDVLFREGDAGFDYFVVLDGEVQVYYDTACTRPILPAPAQAGQFLGDAGLLLGEVGFATARVEADGRVLRVAADTLRALLAADTDLASTVLTAFGARRALTSAGTAGLTLVGSRSDPDAVRLGEFVRRNYLPARWLDFETTPDEAAKTLAAHGLTAESLQGPVVFWGSQTTLHNPSNLDLARAVGIGAEPTADERFDLVVVGAGPAGLAAAVYGASEGLSTVVVDEIGTGGQAGASSRIENYLGFPTGISGTNLAIRATVQARKFGARFVTPHQAAALHRDGDGFAVELADGVRVRGRAVVVATGARYRRLAVPDIERFEGAGVYYAATEMEARACDAATAIVVGGGNSAGQAAMFLSERFAHVRLLLRGGDLGKSMSHYLTARIEAAPRIEVNRYTEVRAVEGDGRPDGHEALAAVTLADTRAGTTERVVTPALFVFVGADPCTEWLRSTTGSLALSTDAHGFVCTGTGVPDDALDATRWGTHRPDGFETSEPGVFAVGDVRS
ncbi:MAG TPA: FAD-dependent oxidoreductase, partial [Rubricoccaceae bacterium]